MTDVEKAALRQRFQRVEYRTPFCAGGKGQHWTSTQVGLSDSLFLYGMNYDLRWEDLDTGKWVYRKADRYGHD